MFWRLVKLVFLVLAVMFISKVQERLDARGKADPPPPPENMLGAHSVGAPLAPKPRP